MSLLLDTHVWIWAQESPAKLGRRTTAKLTEPQMALYVSTISTLEIARLVAAGLIELSGPIGDWVSAEQVPGMCSACPVGRSCPGGASCYSWSWLANMEWPAFPARGSTMGAIVYNLYQAKTALSKLVERAAAGEEIIIAKAGSPRAKLVPLATSGKPRQPGGWEGRVYVSEDFDDPLPDDMQAAFDGRS